MGVILILIPLLLYLLAAYSGKKSKIKHPDEYFTAFRKVGQTEFATSSIAYGFQVSTIYPFLFWGASLFFFVPFINAVFWGVGILLFYFAYKKISPFLNNGKTLHGIIGNHFGLKARIIASILTIIGFLGLIVAELWFGSRVLLCVFPNNNWVYLSIFVFIFFIAIYLFRFGQISSIKTDQLQLGFTYFGIFGIIIYLLFIIFNNGVLVSGYLNLGLVFLIICTPLVLFLRKLRFISLNSKLDKILNGIISLFFIAIIILSVLIIIKGSGKFSAENFINLEGFGYAGLISFIILPLGFQFVDLTNWQRLLSVKESSSDKSIDKNIKKGLLNYAIESPFTWILFLIFGLLITTSFPNMTFEDILIDFPKQMISSNNLIEIIIGYAFIVSIISIMLSTIDSFIMGISFTYTYDINRTSRKYLDSSNNEVLDVNKIIKHGKIFGFLIVLIAAGLFIFFDKYITGGGEMFISLLLAFYTATLSFLPLIIGFIFFKNKPSENWAIASMLISSIAGIGLGVYSVIINPEYAWYPIILSVCLSFFIYFAGLKFSNKNINLK